MAFLEFMLQVNPEFYLHWKQTIKQSKLLKQSIIDIYNLPEFRPGNDLRSFSAELKLASASLHIPTGKGERMQIIRGNMAAWVIFRNKEDIIFSITILHVMLLHRVTLRSDKAIPNYKLTQSNSESSNKVVVTVYRWWFEMEEAFSVLGLATLFRPYIFYWNQSVRLSTF